jgi:hypothetical protein
MYRAKFEKKIFDVTKKPTTSSHKLIMLIEYYFLGLFASCSLLTLWFFSPIKTSISKIFLKKELLPLEFDEYWFNKNEVIGTLVSCSVCLSWWISLLVGMFFVLVFSLPWFWPFLTFFTYPWLCLLLYKVIIKLSH